jgi:hypothetical protein
MANCNQNSFEVLFYGIGLLPAVCSVMYGKLKKDKKGRIGYLFLRKATFRGYWYCHFLFFYRLKQKQITEADILYGLK